ncbi:hypothetical protein HanRHA438_Chr14g0649731 [Helianthus annuus]|uniref:Uncharacterized protein n=1 Tax=Helianthus annuus TaxID=4232 RepID=A0A251SGT5_HELAN|nr:hypothetical protein HanXRQr2_Chr14g0639261 [Helianthus annuus]KAJ0468182.1 hypothetical protein HanIR_Chr14g0693731 [Helianthus annuus]KAJ0853308.1 hypothetical protein HanRHA438_Chr14g0649731 [Helianthus annuus]
MLSVSMKATVTIAGSRVPASVPMTLIGQSTDRMRDLKVILNNHNLSDMNRCSDEVG